MPKIKYAKKDLLKDSDFDPKYGSIRVTLMVNLEVMDLLRQKAARMGMHYKE